MFCKIDYMDADFLASSLIMLGASGLRSNGCCIAAIVDFVAEFSHLVTHIRFRSKLTIQFHIRALLKTE